MNNSTELKNIKTKRFSFLNNPPGDIFCCDNLELMTALADSPYAGKITMIYGDPPYFSKADYKAVKGQGEEKIQLPAFSDKWENGLEGYLGFLYKRLVLMREILSDEGLIFLHLDWHAVHYVRVIMDEIFGSSNFVNEIIWQYKSGGSTDKRFARKHDNILVYSKTKNYNFFPMKEKSYNRGLKPYRFKGVEEFQDEKGWYTLVNMKDVWEIDMVGRTSGERTGYATQKPEALLERMVLASTEKGDIVADFFCGSGTLGAVAAKIGRRFILCDSGKLACETAKDRIEKITGKEIHIK